MATGEEADSERPRSVTSGDLLSDGQLQRLKRLRDFKDAEDDEDFIKVTNKSRRIRKARSRNNGMKIDSNLCTSERIYEVCVTSTEVLPKQIAFAKVLNGLNIPNIVKIKYKSSYKVIISFDNKEQADNLLKCEQLLQKGFRLQRTDELNVCYGIVRQIDIDVELEELHKNFECEYEIVSVRRLKRQTSEGTWVDSETVRLCFRAPTLPPYVSAYGCRFMVETYTFPVSQCAGCWFYGHIKKFCPTKKIVCPKCGANHDNCDTKNYRCVNCKGSHMSIEKSLCPVFKKEKDIRKLMSERQITYKKALSLYLDRQRSNSQESLDTIVHVQSEYNVPTYSRNYRNAVASKYTAKTGNEEIPSDVLSSSIESEAFQTPGQPKKKKKKKKKRNSSNKEDRQEEQSEHLKGTVPKGEKKFDFSKFYNRVKNIMLSSKMLSEKITDFVNLVFEECYLWIAGMIRERDFVTKLLSMLGHG